MNNICAVRHNNKLFFALTLVLQSAYWFLSTSDHCPLIAHDPILTTHHNISNSDEPKDVRPYAAVCDAPSVYAVPSHYFLFATWSELNSRVSSLTVVCGFASTHAFKV